VVLVYALDWEVAMTTYYVEQISTCDRRRLDAQRIAQYLQAHGAVQSDSPDAADYIIAVTCSTTRSNITDSVKMVERLGQKGHEQTNLIIAGCLDKRLNLDVPDDKLLVRLNPKDGLIPLQKALGYADSPYAIRDHMQTQSYVLNVRVQDGCRGKCAFCDIRQKIGSSKTRPLGEIIQDVRQGLDESVRYVRLVGDDVGTFGVDTGHNLVALLEAVIPEIGQRKVMIDNLDPKYLIEQWECVYPILMGGRVHHVKLPIQHFNKRLLKLMRRSTETELIGEIVSELDRLGILVQSHFIYGFPTETVDELIEATSDVIALPFGQIIFIPYSNKERVPAYRMEQIPFEGMVERNRRLKEALVASGDVVEVWHIDAMGLEELIWVRETYLEHRPATAA
jgi:threonylcarbamoyladenosine tRNA methylthiotransferase MtaB